MNTKSINKTLPERILVAIRDGNQIFSTIDNLCRTIYDGDFRATDRALQGLRKRGFIVFKRGKWELGPEII